MPVNLTRLFDCPNVRRVVAFPASSFGNLPVQGSALDFSGLPDWVDKSVDMLSGVLDFGVRDAPEGPIGVVCLVMTPDRVTTGVAFPKRKR